MSLCLAKLIIPDHEVGWAVKAESTEVPLTLSPHTVPDMLMGLGLAMIAIYNPGSKERQKQFMKALDETTALTHQIAVLCKKYICLTCDSE